MVPVDTSSIWEVLKCNLLVKSEWGAEAKQANRPGGIGSLADFFAMMIVVDSRFDSTISSAFDSTENSRCNLK